MNKPIKMKSMKTANYAARQTFIKYDNWHYLLYLNEQKVNFTMSEYDDPIEGYSYMGNMSGGSTIIEAQDVTDDNRRNKFIAGLIGTRYSIDAQIALLANGNDTEEHIKQLHEFAAFRTKCKQDVDELLNR